MPGSLRRAELAQGFRFDLADAFARYVELLPDFLERVLAFAADSETQTDDFLFLGRESLQNVRGLIANVGVDHGIDRRTDPAIFDQIAERGFSVAANWSFERHRVARDGLQLLDLLHRNVHAARDFVVGGRAAQFLFEFARRPQELVHALVHVNGNADGARLVGDGARDGLANPPGGVGRKFVAAPVFELVGGAHQADVAFLDQVQKMQPAVDILLGHRNHQAEVGFHQILLGPLGFNLTVTDHRNGVFDLVERRAGRVFALANLTLDLARFRLRRLAGTSFQLAQLHFEMRKLFRNALDFLGELLPLRDVERNFADRERNFHASPRQLERPAAAELFVAQRNGVELVGNLSQLLVQHRDLSQVLLDFVAALYVGGAFLFQVSAQIDERIQLFRLVTNLFGYLDRPKLHQSRAADAALHAQLPALHTPGQIDFTLAGKQRYRAHLAQVHADRVIRVNGLFDGMGRGELLAFVGFLRMEKVCFFVSKRNCA